MEFTQASLPSPFFLQFYHDQLPHLCNPHRGKFNQVYSVKHINQVGSVIDILAATQDNQDITIKLDFFESGIFRLLMRPGREIQSHTTPILVEDQCSHPVPEFTKDDRKIYLKNSELEIIIGLDPWSLAIFERQGKRGAP